MTVWIMLVRGEPEDVLGLIPTFLDEDDPRPAREQLDANYQHGGGWRPQAGFKMEGKTLRYPGDPPLQPLAFTMFRDEAVIMFKFGYVAIVQPDNSFEAARMD